MKRKDDENPLPRMTNSTSPADLGKVLGKVSSTGHGLILALKVTGHASPKMLKKYIKADTLEVVEKLTDKYEYFR